MANLISLLRTLLALGVVAMLFTVTPAVYWSAFILTVVVIWMDGLDGYVARKFNESSKVGAVIDILGDRVVEVVYWIAFQSLGWVPLWMVLTVVVRGIVVDGVRSLAFEQGMTAFGTTSMMKHPVGVFFVSSRPSRWLYAVAKAVAFALLIFIHIPGLDAWWVGVASPIALVAVYVTVFFCVARGLPVLFEIPRLLAAPASGAS